jgi:hypothetical protein
MFSDMMALIWRRPLGCAVEVLAFSCLTSQPAATSKLPAIAHSEGSIKKVRKQIEVNTAAPRQPWPRSCWGPMGEPQQPTVQGPPCSPVLWISLVGCAPHSRPSCIAVHSCECLRSSLQAAKPSVQSHQPFQNAAALPDTSHVPNIPTITQFTLSRHDRKPSNSIATTRDGTW